MSGQLAIRGLRVRRAEREILRGVDLDVAPGEVCALMGVSGAGKSTVLRAVVALQPFDEGSVRVGDVALRPGPVPPERALRALRRAAGMVFQAHSLFDHLTALENVTLAPVHALGWPRERADAEAMRLLEELGVSHRAHAYPRQLSGGEQQRVAIARSLAPGPMLLLMDEPTSALDPARRGALGDTLRALAQQGRGLLVSTHDVDFAHDFADRVLVLADGMLAEEGPAREILERPKHAATRALLRGEG
ncbi:MAG: amino acid ABC transporter ATP-binding protein [Gemmatimonadaceae bacterium]